jgi:hypothetical protein
MMALYATAGGALRLPYTSGPVPLKSNVALPSRLQRKPCNEAAAATATSAVVEPLHAVGHVQDDCCNPVKNKIVLPTHMMCREMCV